MFSPFFVFLQVRCLDFTDFGSIQIPTLMPRICVWKGDMVKHLSDMTIGRDGKYGCLTVSSFHPLFLFLLHKHNILVHHFQIFKFLTSFFFCVCIFVDKRSIRNLL